jgi:hypothetical protein
MTGKGCCQAVTRWRALATRRTFYVERAARSFARRAHIVFTGPVFTRSLPVQVVANNIAATARAHAFRRFVILTSSCAAWPDAITRGFGYGHAEGGRESVFLFIGRPF